MARRAIAVNDDGGFYSIRPGVLPGSWGTMRKDIEYAYAYERDISVDCEPLMGWAPWTYAVLVNGTAVAFVTGADEPAPEEMPLGLAPTAR